MHRWPYLFVISGKQGSGKSTLARALQSELTSRRPSTLSRVATVKFAAPIYNLQEKFQTTLSQLGIIKDPPKKNGALLQELGQLGRRLYGENVWAEHARRTANSFLNQNCSVIIDDLRHKNELAYFYSDAIKIRLECPRELRMKRAESWRKDEDHISEIDLDNCPSYFDLILKTDAISPEKCLSIIKTQFLYR